MKENNLEYRISTDNLEHNMKKMDEFFSLMHKFQDKSYEQRVELMKQTWSQELLAQIPTSIYYGDLFFVRIYMENNQYKFEFNIEKIDFEEFEKRAPEIAIPLQKKLNDALQKVNQRIKEHLKIPENQNTPSENNVPKKSINDENKTDKKKLTPTEINNLMYYKNIDINFKNR